MNKKINLGDSEYLAGAGDDKRDRGLPEPRTV